MTNFLRLPAVSVYRAPDPLTLGTPISQDIGQFSVVELVACL